MSSCFFFHCYNMVLQWAHETSRLLVQTYMARFESIFSSLSRMVEIDKTLKKGQVS